MSGFTGFCNYNESFTEEKYLWMALTRRMTRRISHRGRDEQGAHVSPHCVLSSARLAALDLKNGTQPITVKRGDYEFTIAFDGMIYNAKELKKELETLGCRFETECDTEVLINAYICFGEEFVHRLNGMFSLAIDDTMNRRTILIRDHFGVRPIFYSFSNGRLVFSSEIKGLFEYSGINPVVKADGLREIFAVGPARSLGCGVFDGIHEIEPGHLAVYDKDGFHERAYYTMQAREHEDSYDDTVKNVRELLIDTVERQISSDIPVCSMLSGGLDSSIVSSIAARALGKEGKTLDTFAFNFEGNEKHFKPSSYQPDQDKLWAEKTAEAIGSDHKNLLCTTDELADSLFEAVIAKDLPGMTDIDGSLLYFCRELKKTHGAAICGEGADEIFGGYPWFHRSELYDGTEFPWSKSIDFRTSLINPELQSILDIKAYSARKLEETLENVPHISGETAETRRIRDISYLTLKWFMPTLIDRADRCSSFSAFQMRLPFADQQLGDYLFNVPWEYKNHNGVVKALLRDSAKGLLPDEILYRKKSPYPKTYNPAYEQMLKQRLTYILKDSSQPIHKILSRETAKALLNEQFDYGQPWFGQLMAGPQLLAYLIQINYWLLHYNIYLDI